MKLRELRITNNSILSIIKGCKETLEEIDLSKCNLINDKGIEYFLECKFLIKLTNLNLDNNNIGPEEC